MTGTLDRCLDPALLRDALRRHWPGVEAVRVLAARRNTSRRRNPNPLTLRCEALQDGRVLPLHARVFRDGASAAAHPGAPVLHLPSLDMLVWPWPHDPGLPQLPALLASADAVELLRWEPGDRATLRFTRDGVARYAKTFGDARGAAVHERLCHAWALARQDRDAALVGEPLGHDAATHTVWQAAAPGEMLAAQHGLDAAAALARALARWHAAPAALAHGAVHDAAHWQAEVAARAAKVARAEPALGARAQRLADRLAATAPSQRPQVLLHGDFHAGQVALHGGRPVLFDFDECTLGDPLEDLAAFSLRPGPGSAFSTALVAAYAQAVPAHFCPAALRWHLALQRLLQASRAFVFQVPDWRAELARHLAHAESLT